MTSPLKELDVGLYREQARKSYNDGVTPDHIPSFAAIRKYVEAQIGEKLSDAQARKLRDNTTIVMINSEAHRAFSRTYGGRNTKAQSDGDAEDLESAISKDFDKYDSYFDSQNFSRGEIDRAIQKAHEGLQSLKSGK